MNIMLEDDPMLLEEVCLTEVNEEQYQVVEYILIVGIVEATMEGLHLGEVSTIILRGSLATQM